MRKVADLSGQDVIRRNLKRIRQDLKKNHDAFARMLRDQLALEWTRATVTLIERGRRDISLEEWLRLEGQFGRAELLQLEDASDVRLGRYELSGKPDPHLKGLSEWNVFARDASKLEGGYWGTIDDAQIDKDLEAERRAAKNLGLSPIQLSRLAHAKWGHSLTAERERLATDKGVDPSNRGHRAHITHDLLTELEQFRKTRRKRQ